MEKLKLLSLTFLMICLLSVSGFAQQDTVLVDDSGTDWSFFVPPGGDGWISATSTTAINGNYHFVRRDNPAVYGQWCQWTLNVPVTDQYLVYFHVPVTGGARNKELYIVQSFGSAPDSLRFNQNENSGNWRIIGMYQLFQSQINYVKMLDDSINTTGYFVFADAVRAIQAKNDPTIESDRSARNNSELVFFPTNIGDTGTSQHKIWNLGKQNLVISGITSDGGNFGVQGESFPVTIPPTSSHEFTFTFAPNSERIFEDTLRISSNDPNEPVFDLPVRGEGTAVTVIVDNSSPPPTYEEIGVWSTSNGAAQCEGIPNETSRYALVSSGQELAIYRPNIPEFSSYNVYYIGPLTSNAAQSALFKVYPAFSASDSVRINQNSASSCEEKFVGTYIFFQGTINEVHVVNDGLGNGYVTRADMLKIVSVPDRPKINIPFTSFDFVDIPKNSTADTTFAIKNLGLQDIVISAINSDSPFFTVTGTSFPLTIPYQQSVDITVQFTPTEIGDYEANLTVMSNDLDFPEIDLYFSGNSIGYQMLVDDSDGPGLFQSGGPTDTSWAQSASTSGVNGTSLFTPIAINPGAWAKYTINAAQSISGGFELWISTIPSSNAAFHAPYLVQQSGSSTIDTFFVNQNSTTTANTWIRLVDSTKSLYLFNFFPGLPGYVTVLNDSNYTFPDTLLGSYVLRADAVKITEPAPPSAIDEILLPIAPAQFALFQNYPNPFNPETKIIYDLPVQGKVELKIFDVLGREVRKLVQKRQLPGRYSVTWDGNNQFGNRVASGVYFYKLEAPGWEKTMKMVMLK